MPSCLLHRKEMCEIVPCGAWAAFRLGISEVVFSEDFVFDLQKCRC